MDPIPQEAIDTLPDSVGYDPLGHKTLEELIHTAEIELDLIEEGQDGTEPKDAAKIKRWLRKWKKERIKRIMRNSNE